MAGVAIATDEKLNPPLAELDDELPPEPVLAALELLLLELLEPHAATVAASAKAIRAPTGHLNLLCIFCPLRCLGADRRPLTAALRCGLLTAQPRRVSLTVSAGLGRDCKQLTVDCPL